MEVFAVAKDGVHIYAFEPGKTLEEPTRSFPAVPTVDGITWSSDGTLLGLLDPTSGGVVVYNAAAPGCEYPRLAAVKPLTDGPIRSFYFSPLGKYLVTWERHVKEAGANLGVWESATGELKLSFILKNQTSNTWPALKWTSDEKICCRMVTDEILIFDGEDLHSGAQPRRLSAPKVACFDVSPRSEKASVALLIPEAKGAPARTLIYDLNNVRAPTASKSFYKANEVRFLWNNVGTGLLVFTSTDVDDTGQNYYGNTALYFMRPDGQEDKMIVPVSDGPVHDVKWSPTQNEFVVLKGPLPCTMTMHDGPKANERLQFGKSHRNTVCWNPYGRFLCLGGFGNLLGDVDFWDKPGQKQMGSTRITCCVVPEWSPDGRHFIGATTSPRMRVDNCIKIYDYMGNHFDTVNFEQLLFAGWRPRLRGAFQDRPPSPGRSGPKAGAAGPGAAAPKKQAYRPPGARGGAGGYAGGGSLGAQLRAELGSTSAGVQKQTATKVTGIPGESAEAAEEKAANSRNARKKKAKEQAQAAEEAAKKDALAAALAPQKAFEVPAVGGNNAEDEKQASTPECSPEEIEKKVRNLKKKLKDIEKLKEKDPASLGPDQKTKLEGEADLLKQLKGLGGSYP